MISPIQLGKTYGVLHTESFFSFLGFAKKIGSDEIQKIDVFLDDKLIDTIEANEFIQKIDDMYDVESKAFKYNLPSEYIGKKAILSFKNHDSEEELLNSPYTLIDKNHEKFNEAIFFNTLNFEFDNKKIQNINTKDSIGFLATEDNTLNKDLIKLINTFLEQNLETRFKLFYFNNEQKKLISEQFNKYLSKIDFIMPKDIYDIANNTSIYIHSSTENEKPKDLGYYKTWQVLNQTKANMFMINIFEEIDDKEYSKSLKLVDNCKIEFEKSVVSKIFETDERYNEFCFMNSLNQPINDEIKNIYSPNSIGFLATKENLEDEEFMGYIKELMERFPDVEFKGFCFDKFNNNLISLKIIEIKCAGEIIPNIEIFIANSKIKDIQLSNKIFNKNHKITTFNYSKANDTFNPNTIYHENPLIKFHKNFSITEEDLKSVNNNLNLIMHNLICKKLGIDIKIQNYNQSTNNFWKEVFINYSLQNKNYKELLWETRTDIAKMRQS